MDVDTFVAELLRALASTGRFDRVELGTEGPIADGYAYVQGRQDLFVRFYFNQHTQTIAFALIQARQRVWGIDRDNRRGWHIHPVEDPATHVEIEPLSVTDIVDRLRSVLDEREKPTTDTTD